MTAVGTNALANSTGADNIALGAGAGSNVSTASNVICIGAQGEDVSNTCYIGNTWGVAVGDTVPVLINSVGKLGT